MLKQISALKNMKYSTADAKNVFLTDAHMHLNELSDSRYDDIKCLSAAITCTARRSEWYAPLTNDIPAVCSYGIHPWYCEEWNESTHSELISILEKDSKSCVGEIGLDAKHGDISKQIVPFIEQMKICSEYGRVATIHMVGGCEKHILDTLREYGKGCKGEIIHSFKGPVSYVKAFTESGCYFSVSPRIMLMSEEKIRKILCSIPSDRLLLETDYPNTGRNFESMEKHLTDISSVLKTDCEELSHIIYDNIKRLIE